MIMSICAGVNFVGLTDSIMRGRVGIGIFQAVSLVISIAMMAVHYSDIKE